MNDLGYDYSTIVYRSFLLDLLDIDFTGLEVDLEIEQIGSVMVIEAEKEPFNTPTLTSL